MTDVRGASVASGASGMVRVAVAQIPLSVGDVPANSAAASRAVVAAADLGARLVVLPELANSGYVFRDKGEALSLAEPLDGRSVEGWTALAQRHDLVICAGLCLHCDGALRNAAVVVDGSGLLGVYFKAHLWADEQDIFVPGTLDPLVVDTSAGRIGLLVCYDLEFPEWVRRAAVAGAELIAAPTNWPFEPAPSGERHRLVVNAQGAAYVNHVFIAVADRCGEERGAGWVGGSVIIGPNGYPLAGPVVRDEPALLVAEVELASARDKTVGPRNDVLADRRTDLY